MTDEERAERGRGFLRALEADEDGVEASAALYQHAQGRPPDDLPDEWCAALDRLLAAWAVEEINAILGDLGVDEVVLRRNA